MFKILAMPLNCSNSFKMRTMLYTFKGFRDFAILTQKDTPRTNRPNWLAVVVVVLAVVFVITLVDSN